VTIPEVTLFHNLQVTAARYPRKAATVYLGRSMSYGELLAQALALGGWLAAHGVQAGERVALFMQNCPQFLVAFYGVQAAGGVVVPVNPMNRADEFGHYITDPGTRVVICATDLAGVVQQAQAALPAEQRAPQVLLVHYADALPAEPPGHLGVPVSLWQALSTTAPAAPEVAGVRLAAWSQALSHQPLSQAVTRSPDDLALLPYTSGTTGLPKGCMHTHRTLMANVVGSFVNTSQDTTSLAVVPMFHITGMQYGVLMPVYSGTTLIVMPRWDRELAGRLISIHKVTVWVCIPTMIIDLFGSPNYRKFDLSSLMVLAGGGAAMPQAVAQRLLDEFNLKFAEGYGLTETAAPSHSNPPDRPKLQCLGIPIFGVDSRIIDPQTLQELPQGESGEIVTHGPMVFKGYWKHPEATEQAFIEIDGKRFFRTGDLGRIDEDGYFFITDRLKRMINACGFKVWPTEVELLLYKCPLVLEACIIAAKDSYRGETVKAVVVPRPEAREQATEQAVIDWARQHMAAYKVPRMVSFVERLPKSGSGKVMRRLLQEEENREKTGA
jgi:fatty-acyl-CoA synthase